ncbi:MAG: trypsin-like serine protease [Acidimicrobiales bacterium]
MRTRLFAALAALLVAVGLSAPAAAIRDGQPDNGAHPYVGLVVFYYDSSGAPTHRCSGTMISSTTLLTAGHCTVGTASAQVWFNEHVTLDTGYPFTGGITGSTVTYPGFGFENFPNTGDIGVVLLDAAPGVGSASIAGVGTLDSLATQRGRQNVNFDVVGYGLQEVKPTEMAERSRLKANVKLVNLRSALTDGFNIHHTNAPGTGGGTCFGDSGGPVFSQGTSTIVAVTSFGLNQNCAGSGFGYRVDTSEAAAFINQYI